MEVLGGEKNGKPQGTPRRPPGDLSQASDRGKPQWLPERLYSREQKRAPMAPARLLCLLFTLQFRGRDNC